MYAVAILLPLIVDRPHSYLANDMEEDDEEEKIKIFPWALGRALEGRIPLFLAHRDELWARMEFRERTKGSVCIYAYS